jgi:hypothetical protein
MCDRDGAYVINFFFYLMQKFIFQNLPQKISKITTSLGKDTWSIFFKTKFENASKRAGANVIKLRNLQTYIYSRENLYVNLGILL